MGVFNIMDQARKIFEAIKKINSNAEFIIRDASIEGIEWHNGTTPIPVAEIEAKMAELPTEEEKRTAKENLKASAKAKLIAGQPLTEEEADTIVL
jgi:hypothetical protein